MSKYFCVSDIHGFYDELMEALNKASFDINNPSHILIVCGDIFDRGPKPLEVYNFLKSLPKERRVLIRGNHEHLLRDLVARKFPEDHDHSNGTYDTLFALAGLETPKQLTHNYYKETSKVTYGEAEYEAIRSAYLKKIRSVYSGLVKEIIEWIYSDDWVNYYELPEYICVHGFIPYSQDHVLKWYTYYPTGPKTYREDWRNATDTEWEDASWFNWSNSWEDYKNGLNKTGKTLIVGHWHSSDFFNHLTKQKKTTQENPIFISKKYKLIALDACTALTHKINVYVIDC